MRDYIRQFNSRVNYKEMLIACSILVFSCLFYFHVYSLHEEALLTTGEDVWFQGDMPRITDNMTDRFSWGQNRLKVHPLLSLQTYPPTYVLKKLGMGDYQAIQFVSVTIAGLWSLTLYAFMRVFGCRRLDAVLLLMLAWSSAATLFWLPTPESYALGSISIMSALILAIVAGRKKVADWVFVIVSAFSFSVTVTNWMAGIWATLTTQTIRKAIILTLAALCLVTLLWLIEKQIFPAAVFFIGDDEEANYMYYPHLHRIYTVMVNIFSHSMISPEILTLPNTHLFGEGGFDWIMVSIQNAAVGSATIQGKIATLLWGCLLGLGIWSFFKSKLHTPYRITLLITLVGQIVLHILYGEETFLYSLHFLPLFIGFVAFSTLNQLRPIAIILMIVLIPLLMMNNWQQFNKARDIAVSPRQDVLNQMALRPLDSWSRFDSHALLAIPGSLESDKSYIEPGGSFSPKVGSFGLSIWLTNHRNTLLTSSDIINRPDTQQSLEWQAVDVLPSIVTQTHYYKSIVSILPDNSWQYNTYFFNASTLNASLLIRGVGPAGGHIYKLRWDKQQLVINDTWLVTFSPTPLSVNLGEEGIDPWFDASPNHTSIQSKNGWAFANVQVDATQHLNVVIQELKPLATYTYPSKKIASELTLNLPDHRFSNSINAQVAHMMMSLVNNETRPGEPINYPLGWQRDGAYILAALARAGQLDKAKLLSKEFAETDFFGGFGAEADAPGLSIWALNQVALQLKQPDHDQWLWPHVQRKAQLIEQMLTTKNNIHLPFKGKIVPQYLSDPEKHLVAEPAKNGLIIGRMDHHRPLLFVNAVSYRGLLDAADLAERLEKFDEAKHWQALAKQLKAAWTKSFQPPHSDNERTYISGLWPTWVATDVTHSFTKNLDQLWLAQHDANNQYISKPLWTYFDIAETHQWLYLGHPERVWSTLEWFWQHQSMPGLYTWWEGEAEENSFGFWQNVRGWVKPKNVNPHYWTAAEMALLQMDMLGYIAETTNTPTLIIGGGIPTDWLHTAMGVEKLQVGAYVVDWHWKNNVMQVVVEGKQPIEVKLAKHFPAKAKLVVTYRHP